MIRLRCSTLLPAATLSILSIAAVACDSDPRVDRHAAADATFRVRADGCGPRSELGTGTLIDGGLVVTAAHVVAGADRVDVVAADGEQVGADVVGFDPDLDLALLRPLTGPGDPATLRAVPAGEDERGVVAVFAADESVELIDVTVVRTVTIATTDIYRDRDVDRAGFEIDAPIDPGDSGAMVYLPGGGAGIVWARSSLRDGRAWAIDLPSPLLREADRQRLTDVVDTGPCL